MIFESSSSCTAYASDVASYLTTDARIHDPFSSLSDTLAATCSWTLATPSTSSP